MAFKNDVADDVAFKNDVADDMAPVWPRRAPRLATQSGHHVWPPRLATPFGHLSGTPSGLHRAPRPASIGHPVRPRLAPVRPPSGTPSGTPVSSRGSGQPSISEPLDRCPFGPPTVALPFTYINHPIPHCITFSTLPFALGPVTVLL
jgi:hypothetical protein